jgi:N-acetylmuramoyl-L-alanine amidase
MIANRREALRSLGLGAVVVGAGLIPARAFAANTDHRREQVIPPRNRKSPILRAQPPYRYSEERLANRRKKSGKGHHPKIKARSLRAQATLDTPGNRRDLALTMWGEARGYGTLGMRAIGHVIMNRVKEDRSMFGRGIKGVCHKRKQFSCWNEGDPNRERMEKLPHLGENNPDWIAFLKADKLAGQILAGIDKDNTAGATFYHAEYMIPYWRDDMIPVGVMFGHIFYKPKSRRPHTHESHHRGHSGEYSHAHKSHHRSKKTLRLKSRRKPVNKTIRHGGHSEPEKKIRTGHALAQHKSGHNTPLPMRHHR